MKTTQLVDQFQRARKDPDLAVIEGIQALKHAVRFNAELLEIVTCDIPLAEKTLATLAPDISHMILDRAQLIKEVVFNKLSPQPPRTKIIALAKRKIWQIADVVKERPLIFLEDPRDLENIGAVIRVAAAANSGGVCITGDTDVWHPGILRGSAGLHYALPVLQIKSLQTLQKALPKERTVFGLDPEGKSLEDTPLDVAGIYVFGTERHGITPELLGRCDYTIRLPMPVGVSSLNLATSVAATLYQPVFQ